MVWTQMPRILTLQDWSAPVIDLRHLFQSGPFADILEQGSSTSLLISAQLRELGVCLETRGTLQRESKSVPGTFPALLVQMGWLEVSLQTNPNPPIPTLTAAPGTTALSLSTTRQLCFNPSLPDGASRQTQTKAHAEFLSSTGQVPPMPKRSVATVLAPLPLT